MKFVVILGMIAGVAWWTPWFTADQYAQRLMERGDDEMAAKTFHDPMWQGIAWYRAGEFEQAMQAFARQATPEAEFNRGNCLVMLGKYNEAVERYDRALELQPGWNDAIVNRDLASARAKLLDSSGGDMGDQKLGVDDFTFDKKEPGGQDTEVSAGDALSDASMQSLWLRRVQTKPADFLRAKFAYQLAIDVDPERHE